MGYVTSGDAGKRPPLGKRVPGTRYPCPAGTAVIRLGAGGWPPLMGKMGQEGLGAREDAATLRSGIKTMIKRAKV